ncbi:uncharacterized protein LOC130671857 [Microplitis mediator]|uniref:uncharacterized protein LOC130671857 n=1 Tax=Microplitis mediator TaxID=375433 RepID=UPI002552125E|nr:uncharacterized protein LOC130671857 [Microplitis mediator]
MNSLNIGTNFTREEFLYHILQWDPKLVLDDDNNDNNILSNDDIPFKLISPSSSYDTFDNYYKVQLSVLLHEFWYKLRRINEDNKKSENKDSVLRLFVYEHSLKYKRVNSKDDLLLCLKVHTSLPVDPEVEVNPPKCESFVRFTNKLNDNNQQFGFLSSYIKRERTDEIELTYQLVTKYSTFDKIPASISVETIWGISPYLKLIDSLINLPNSPLCDAILKPSINDYEFSIINNDDKFEIVTADNLNQKQLEIVGKIVKTVEDKKTGIYMVSGPAGTGKTKVIVNSVLTMIHRKSTEQMLICAHSNLAIDSIVLQLLKEQSRLKNQGIEFTIVRIGITESMNESVRQVSISRFSSKMRRDEKSSLLKQYNIIAGTLSSYQSYFMQSYIKYMKIPICIIDEAPQASECHSFLPLMLGVKTLILVGDSKLLWPKFYSEGIKNNDLDQSLFARAEKIFKGTEKNPILSLDVQYRMDESIAQWPNKFFYKGALKNSVPVETTCFYKYRVLNHSCLEVSDDYYLNVGEAKLVVNVAYTLMTQINLEKVNSTITIGIISLTVQQDLITELLEKRTKYVCTERKEKINVCEVKIVDHFQSIECDIIIMSCVRSYDVNYIDVPSRLCASLTRAKKSMIICGNFEKYEENIMWKDLLNDAKERNAFINLDHDTYDKPKTLKPYLII